MCRPCARMRCRGCTTRWRAVGEPSIERSGPSRVICQSGIRNLRGRQQLGALPADVHDHRSLRVVQRDVRVHLPAPARRDLARARRQCLRFVEHRGGETGRAFDAANGQARRREVMHHHRARHQEHHQRSDDRQVELEMELAQLAVLLFREHVAGAAQRENAARPLRIVFDGRAQARDVHVDRPVEVLERFARGEVHQRLA